MVIETSQFRAKEGISDEQVLAASQQAQEGYLSQCKGYVSRTLTKGGDGTWLDIVEFATNEDAQAAMQEFVGNPHTKAFEGVIDAQTAQMHHWEVVTKY